MRTKTTRLAAPAVALAAVLAVSGCADQTQPDPDTVGTDTTPAAAPAPEPIPVERLTTDAEALADGMLRYQAVRGEFPYMAEMVDVDLADGAVVTQYATGKDSFAFCVISEADGAWAAFQSDRGGVTATGAKGRCTFAQ